MNRKTACFAVAVAVAVLIAPASASATPDPVGSGSATIRLAAPFASLLRHNRVGFASTAPGSTARAATLPLGAGHFDPNEESADLDIDGNLVLRRGNRSVVFRGLTVKTKPAPLIAKVGGGQLKIATGKLSFARSGFGARLGANRLELTEKVATRLSKKLGLRGVFRQGQAFASLRLNAQPATVAVLPQGRASLAPDPAFLAKLDSQFISLNPVAPAERTADPFFTFPLIPAGTIAPDGASGIPRTGGSLEFLQLGSGQIFWQEPWLDLASHQLLAEVDIEPTPTFPGKLGQISVAGLAPGAISADPAARTVTITGAALTLNATSAAQFNQAFAAGKSTFEPGEPLGTITFTAPTH